MARAHITIRWLAASILVVLALVAMSANAAAKTKHHGSGTGGTAAAPKVGQPVPAPVGSTTGTITFTPANVVEHQSTLATGVLSQSDAGQPVSLEIEAKPGVWDSVANSTVGADGSFAINWKASVVGIFTMRVVSGAVASATTSVSSPEAPLTIMSSVIASWYGPGFFGHRTACGETLTRHILGVASRTLPCGTPVTLTYNGQTLTVPVIDRGPYANSATFDLTYATASALGILDTVSVGYTDQLGKKMPATNWYPVGVTGPSGVTGSSGSTGTSGSTGGGMIGGGATAP